MGDPVLPTPSCQRLLRTARWDMGKKARGPVVSQT